MADTALRLLPGGQTEKVRIEEITEENRHDNYICDGINASGQLCGAAVYPRISGNRPCFCVGVRYSRHICGCPNDETEAAQIIRHLDVTGRNTTIEDLMVSFGRVEGEGDRMRRGPRVTGPAARNAEGHAADTVDDRRIEHEARNPRNVREFTALLIRSNLSDTYAGTSIGKLIVDHRNVDVYRQDGLYDGQTAVVLCKRLGPKYLDKLVPGRLHGDVIVGDAYAYEDQEPPLKLVIDGSAEANNKIFHAPKRNIIAIFAKWHQHPTYPNTYTCEHIHAGQVFAAPSNFFE